MATDPHADQSEFFPPVEWQEPLTASEQIAIQARRQAEQANDPVPPIGGAYSRERFGS